jgi:hypothetical protein
MYSFNLRLFAVRRFVNVDVTSMSLTAEQLTERNTVTKIRDTQNTHFENQSIQYHTTHRYLGESLGKATHLNTIFPQTHTKGEKEEAKKAKSKNQGRVIATGNLLRNPVRVS